MARKKIALIGAGHIGGTLAHLVMELLYESGLKPSLDLVELNPFLDERGKSALLLVDLTASLFGRQVYPTTRASDHGVGR